MVVNESPSTSLSLKITPGFATLSGLPVVTENASAFAEGASLTLPIAIVKTCVAVDPSVLVARTVTLWLVEVSKSSEPLTVTRPLAAVDRESTPRIVVKRIGNRVGRVRIDGKCRQADNRPDCRVLVDELTALSLSTSAVTSNSSTSSNANRKNGGAKRAVTAGAANRDVAARTVRFAIDRTGHGHHAGAGIDGESSAVVVIERIGDRVVGRIRVAGRSGDTDGRSDGRILIDLIRRCHRCQSPLPTSNSSTSLMLITKPWSVNDPSAEVARTVILRAGPSASRSIAPATVTTPVLESMANRPPSLSCSE